MALEVAPLQAGKGRTALQRRVYEILEPAQADDWQSRAYDRFIVVCDVLIIADVVLGTVDAITSRYQIYLSILRAIVQTAFVVDYLLRVWTSTCNPLYKHPLWGRLRYTVSFFGLVDLFAVGPAVVAALFFPPATDIGKVLRLSPLLRTLQMLRYSEPLRTFGRVLRAKRDELFVMLSIVCVLLLVASSLVYLVEHNAQPNNFGSILDAMWWAIITLTSVGYGDMYPVTPVGKLLGGLIALMGIGIFALPAGILAAGFSEELRKRKTKTTCPHCGKDTGVITTVFSKKH
ncbi:ion transporter [Gloeobacter kilaueensis]|uniref:Ion transport protein n=1 Tax=Gloeobacter kilaueensis (strain ATCC BAA-2537 / CCAP 1431/1 / ULC 316 / JS1) TaxID=1183438 RepID=U5QID6_GLOK1|nr:ion transporter [Gloeobacter kilaueensis]AGY58752.1 ion transport protein [Gloeobacter kilaueensis JS1]